MEATDFRMCGILILILLLKPSMQAMVAQDKVIEMVQQVKQQISELQLGAQDSTGQETTTTYWTEPLSLQLAVLQVTDSLNREMSLPKWQAMLRALGGDREILKRFTELRPRFSALEKQASYDGDAGTDEQLTLVASFNTSATSWGRLWPHLQSLIQTVSNLHDWFDRYQRNAEVVNERTLRDYAETVHGTDGLTTMKAIESLHTSVCPFDVDDENDSLNSTRNSILCSGGAFDRLKNALLQAKPEAICALSKSPHQLVYDFYSLLALTDAKGYVMMQFSWMLLRLYGKGNFTFESDMARADFENRVIEKTRAARSILSQLPSWLWKCDTPKSEQLENETFIQFTEVLQGYIVNEVDLNQDNTCKESCVAYTNSQEKSCFGVNQFCSQSRRCSKGRIYNCAFVEADSRVCTSNAPGRRYDWVEYKSGRLHGHKSQCNQPGNQQHQVDSWWRWLFWHCSYCTCLCDQPGARSDRYVSLQSALASASSNYLVTGIRFVKVDRVVHIQIQEGETLPQGAVNTSTLNWRPITPVNIPKYREDSLEDGPGYATLRYEERALDLDDLLAPEGYVITGLRFRKLGGHINLEAQVSPIDFSTGLINVDRANWMSNDNTPAAEHKPRRKLSLESPDIPTRSSKSLPDSVSDQYIEFQASSLEKDLSQTTVPYLDSSAIFPQPPTWLSGVGVYHKGSPGYGGYIAFRIATFNMTNYVNVPSDDLAVTGEEFLRAV